MAGSKKISFHTLGCKLNFSETSTLARDFEAVGFSRVTSKGEKADVYVINTCSVTDHADKKCRNIIRKMARENPDALIVVTGCYAQLKASEIASIEGVDLVVGNNDKASIVELVRGLASKGKSRIYTCEVGEMTSFFSSFSSGDRTRAFLKVQDGCDYKCSYCTIPLARGASRNISIDEITEAAKEIASKGQKEIVLTGVNIGDFGRTTGESFLDLIRSLDNVDGIDRYRISSIEPNLLTDEVLEFTRLSKKFQPHFHIPLQSGSEKVLKLMRRRYNISQFSDKIKKVKSLMPDVFIGIDVIVGFPGESDADFEECYTLLEELKPAYLHVFPYSERANTPAIDFPEKVSPKTSAQRVARLSELCHRLHSDFCSRYIGQRMNVLVEGTKKGGMVFGYTENYIRVELPYRKNIVGEIIEVELKAVINDGSVVYAEEINL